VLQSVHGGAHARPFATSINAYRLPLYLRIAPELYLKRLCVGGLQNVFELGRNFRNEGADATHNPEFTSLEAYQAFADYHVMRELMRELVLAAALAVHGESVARRRSADGEVTSVDLSVPWPVVPVHEAVSRATGAPLTPSTPQSDVLALCRSRGVPVPATATAGEAVVGLYEALVESSTTTPTFYTDFPLETSPLARVHRNDPRLAERWDLVAFGSELGTAYSELIDPLDQRRRLTEQSLRAAAGDPEAMELDEAFLEAMAYAMPPTGGLGLGVDRLLMLLTGGTIRSTLTFPFVRPDRTL
ncbi:MAG: lysine--tRNA ligase, partial [Geodermatophilales bacterium]|nr:lysine--tRNA ligase [Geodermatophilales bacterium]